MKTAGARKKTREGIDREPNGRKRRGRTARTPQEAADKMTLAVRARHAGLTLAEAKDQRAGTFVGLLRIRGIKDRKDPTGLSEAQYDALQEYATLRADYHRAISAPGCGVSGEGPGGGGSEISSAYITWCSKIKERYAEAKAAIALEQEGNRTDNLWAALDLCVHQDQRLYHMVGSLRVVANALTNHFGKA